jgi:hypothetical protein
MPALLTPEEKARMVLKIYEHLKTRPGDVLGTENFLHVGTAMNFGHNDIADGLEHGILLGWFKHDPNGWSLTETGYAEM